MYKQEEMKELEEKVGYVFRNKELLREALTHSSFSNEQKINRYKNYERLEFLGDAVLELLSSRFFFDIFPEMTEGQLTKLRASLVCEPALAYCAREIKLEKYILLGKGEEATGGRNRDSIISDVMEAVLGAIYLDGGIEEANKYVHSFILADWQNKKLFYDSKTILQEKVQKSGKTLSYELISQHGPEHNKIFEVSIKIDGEAIGKGQGRNKKSAEQQAAYKVLIDQILEK